MDSNANGVLDQKEVALSNVAIKVSRENEIITTTTTDSQGNFSVPSKGTGYYCVEVVDIAALSQVLMDRITSMSPETAHSVIPISQNVGFAPKQLGGGATGPTTTTPVCGNHIVEYPEECDDGNTISGDGCSSTCKKEQTTSPPATTTPSTSKPGTVTSGSVCQNLDGTTLIVHVPVRLDYQAEISQMPPPSLKTYKPGDSFDIAIPVPVGCFLKTLFIPDTFEITPGQKDSSIDTIDSKIGRLDFKKDMSASSVGISLKVKIDKNIASGRAQIKPQVLCPDGQTVPIPAIEIDLNTKPDIKIEQSVGYRNRTNLTVGWQVNVQNNGDVDYGNVTVKATLPPDSTIVDSARCSPSGEIIECSENLSPHKTFNKIFVVTLKAPGATNNTTVYFNVSVTFSDYPDTISAPEMGLDVP